MTDGVTYFLGGNDVFLVVDPTSTIAQSKDMQVHPSNAVKSIKTCVYPSLKVRQAMTNALSTKQIAENAFHELSR